MKKLLLLSLFIFAIASFANAQCTGTVLSWQNPSFEGTPGTPHVTPPLWDICQPGCTPDTQPGCWGVTLPPSNGSSYVGFVAQTSASWFEGASQTLSSPMVPGTTYNFTADLAVTASTAGGIMPGCVEMQIWGNMGGNSGCDETALLWSSGDVFDAAHMDQWVTHTITITPTSAWTHLLFMIHNLGCTDQPYIMMDNLTPIAPVADVPQFTWTNVCLGNPMSFTSTSTSVGTILSYDWDWGDATAHGTGATPTHTYASAGTYNVLMTMISNVPCTTTVTHQVIVYPNPTITVAPAAPTICTGGNTSLTAAGASTYSWNPGGLSGTTVTVSPATTTTYSVTGTDANGCTNSTTVLVTVVANPTPTVTTVDASCGLSNGSATANPAGLTYAWSNAGVTTQTISNLPAGTYTVTVSGGGCTGTAVRHCK
jgi:PKD repeat protein